MHSVCSSDRSASKESEDSTTIGIGKERTILGVENKPYIQGTQMSLYKLAGNIRQYKMLANSDNFQFSLSPTFFAVVDTHCQLKHL